MDQPSNPYSSPVSRGDEDASRVAKRIDTLYRNCKQMAILTGLGFFIPILMVLAAPLGIVYAFQRSKLLQEIDRGELLVPAKEGVAGKLSSAEQITFLREHVLRLYVAPFIVGFVICIIALAMLAGSVKKSARAESRSPAVECAAA